MNNSFENIPRIKNCGKGSYLLIAGPCVIEDETTTIKIAESLSEITDRLGIPFVFKGSYRKANRSRYDSFTGIGDTNALKVLKRVSELFDIPVLTDIHNPEEASIAAEYVDVIQIPAFLCRQTDLLRAAGITGKWINIKKGQFLSGASMRFAAEKVKETGNDMIMLTDRGNMYGYQDIVVDFRNIEEMKVISAPVIMDITHSLQQPNRESGVSGGRPEMIEIIGRAAIAAGADGIFLETHPEPGIARSDGENMLPLHKAEVLLHKLLKIKLLINTM